MLKVLMLGTARNVKGGITTVVNNYFECGIENYVNIKYIETVNDKNNFLKIFKIIKGFIEYVFNIFNYDIVHLHMASRWSTFRKGIYVYLSKLLHKKVVLHIHGGEFDVFFNNECSVKKQRRILKMINLSDKIIVLSKSWKNFFLDKVDKSKICIMYNSIIVPKIINKDLNTNKFLFLGILGKRKGIYDLLEVFERIKVDYPNLKLYIGGNGEVEKVKKIIKKKRLENNVFFLGWIKGEEKEKILESCSYYILPSYNEGMPLSVIEGMAYRNVTISTNVGGTGEIINNGYNGILIEPGNIEQLYKVIIKLINDNKLRIKLSNNGYKTIKEKFNVDKNLKVLVDLYNKI